MGTPVITFRLSPVSRAFLEGLATGKGCTRTDALEHVLAAYRRGETAPDPEPEREPT